MKVRISDAASLFLLINANNNESGFTALVLYSVGRFHGILFD